MGSHPAWKKAEREAARFFGAERTPLSGGNSRISRSDSTHELLFVETKRFPSGKFSAIESLFNVTATRAAQENKTPVVCLKRAGKHGFLIVLKNTDLLDVATLVAESQQKKRDPEL